MRDRCRPAGGIDPSREQRIDFRSVRTDQGRVQRLLGIASRAVICASGLGLERCVAKKGVSALSLQIPARTHKRVSQPLQKCTIKGAQSPRIQTGDWCYAPLLH